MDDIQKYGVDGLQRPLLPLFGDADLVWIRLTDIGLFFSTRDSNSPFRSQGNDTAKSPKLVRSVFAAIAVVAVFCILVLVFILAVARLVIRLYPQSIRYELSKDLFKQMLDVPMLPMFAICSSLRIFSRRVFSPGV